MAQRKVKQNKKSFKPGCIFWIALILLGIIVFIINHKNIDNILDSTGFFDLFSRSKSNTEQGTISVERITDSDLKKPGTPIIEDKEIQLISAIKKPAESDPVEKPESVEEEIIESEIVPGRTRESKLYFIKINDDGSISLIEVVRNVKYTDSPLTATLKSLLAGLSADDISNNYISLIPENTVLNKVYVTEGTAYIDFNEYFLFNSFGREGYIGQLKQIVYTATEFSTVDRVQFLIDGKIKSYLGSEGIYAGKPIDRNFFN